MPSDDAALTAVKDGSTWRWRWRAPWASTTTSPGTYKTQRAALTAGRKWLAQQAQ